MTEHIRLRWNAAKHNCVIAFIIVLGSAITCFSIYFGADWVRIRDNSDWAITWGNNFSRGFGVWGDGNNIYTCGYTTKYSVGATDATLIKWDRLGNELWLRIWGGSGDDHANDIWGDNLGNIYTCGFSSYGVFVNKWDANGNLLWNRTLNGSGSNAYSLWGDGEYIYVSCVNISRPVLTKLDTSGNQIWTHLWDIATIGIKNTLWGDGAGNIYTCGDTASLDVGNKDILLLKWDTDGNVLWYRTWGGSEQEDGKNIWGSGNAIYTCGYTRSFGPGSGNLVLVKWDGEGNQIWNRTLNYGESSVGDGIWGTGTTIYTCGRQYIDSENLSDMMVVKWDSNGNQLRTYSWGGSKWDSAESIWGDGINLYVTGYSYSDSGGEDELFLVKLGSALSEPKLPDSMTVVVIVGLALVVLATIILISYFIRKKMEDPQQEVVYHQPK